MINIILCDEDTEAIKNFRNYIRGSFADLKIIGVLTDNGRDIMSLIRDMKPNLMIADVRFFGPYGFKTFRDIYDRFPEIRFILYGSHNDADYLKQSREWGVLDSMYHPVRPVDLARCIHTAITYFKQAEQERKEERDLNAAYRERIHVYKDIFLRGLMSGTIKNEREINYAFEYFQMKFEKGFTVLHLKIDHFKTVALTFDEKEKHMLGFKITKLAREAFKDYAKEMLQQEFNSLTILLGGYEALEKIIAICEELKENIHKKLNVRVTVGVGRTYDEPADISVSKKEAESALRYRFHVGYNTVIPIQFVEPNNSITYRYPSEKEDRLVYTAAIGEYDYCHVLINEIFDVFKECGPLPEYFCSKMVLNILISVNRTLSEQNITLPAQFTSFFSTKEVLELQDPDESMVYLDETLKKICAAVVEFYEENSNRLMKMAKEYIDEHYFETFSLPKAALYVGTTQEYIHKLFLDREGTTLLDYAVRSRFNEAKRLIRENNEDDEMVAVKVGYDDVRHFRSLFRQYEGINTSDYRAQFSGNRRRTANNWIS